MPVVIIKEVLSSKKAWREEFDKRYNYVKRNIGKKHCFEKQIRFKFNKNDDNVFVLHISDFITNMIMWRPFVKHKVELGQDLIMDCSNITQRVIKGYIDDKIIEPLKRKVEVQDLSIECAKIIEGLAKIDEDFGLIMAMGMNLYDTIQMTKRSPRYKELINTIVPHGLQPSEIENYIRSRGAEMVEILKTEPNNLKPFLNSGQGVKVDQLNEFQLSGGMKSDLEGNTYPMPINTNLLTRGFDKPSYYTLDAFGGRKALIMNKEFTGKSGYFARRLDLLCMDIKLHDDPHYICNTKHYIEFAVLTYEHLEKIEGRKYKKKRTSNHLRTITLNDTQLIGQVIYLRSPSYCASKKGICYACYGDLAHVNNNGFHIGLFAVKDLSAKLTQNILSAKHLLKTKSKQIQMTEGFDNYFTIDGGDIVLQPDADVKGLEMIIDEKDVQTESEFDEAMEFNKKISYFRIRVKKSKKQICTIREVNESEPTLFISEYLDDLMEKHYDPVDKQYVIPMNKIKDDEEGRSLYAITILNNELTKPLKDIMALVDNKAHLDCETPSEMVQKFCELLLSTGLSTMLVHAEIILRNIIRDDNSKLHLPDYTKDEIEYELMSVKKALKFHPSALVSLSFERIEEQLRRPMTYKKTAPSMFDPLFMQDYNQVIDVYGVGNND